MTRQKCSYKTEGDQRDKTTYVMEFDGAPRRRSRPLAAIRRRDVFTITGHSRRRREFRRRSAEEQFPIFDMFTEDPSKGCSRDRVASACLIGLQVYSLVTLYTYLLGFIPGFASLHMQLQLLVSTPLVVASIDVVTNQFVVKAARAVGILPKPPTKWGGAPVVVPPPSPHATESV